VAYRTKQALAQALRQLLNTRTLDKITVKDITDCAGLNRQTFYYHFQDVYDLIRWIFEEGIRDHLDLEGGSQDLRKEMSEVFRLIQDERDLVLNAYRSISRDYLEQYMLFLLERILRPRMEADPASAALTAEEREFVLNFYNYAIVGLLENWIRGGMKGEAELLIERAHRLMDGELHRALLRFANGREKE